MHGDGRLRFDGPLIHARAWEEIATDEPWLGHTSCVWPVAFSPDDRPLVSSSDDGVLLLWNVATGKVRQTLSRHRRPVRCVTFDPVGLLMASASDDQTVR